VESGIMTAEEALYHPDRHLISNVIGSDQMSVELGPWISLSPRDTVLLASDGLFDNLLQEEIVEFIRIGRPVDCVRKLAELARKRMLVPSMNVPSKPDDLSILLYRAVA
jgi:serine/threonine protein phosphatase PrpC